MRTRSTGCVQVPAMARKPEDSDVIQPDMGGFGAYDPRQRRILAEFRVILNANVRDYAPAQLQATLLSRLLRSRSQ